MKTLAVKLDDELHAQLTMLGQVLNTPVTTLMLQGVKEHVERLTKSGDVSGKAEAMLQAIDDEAAKRRQALTKLLEGEKAKTTATPQAKPTKAAQG